MYLHTAILHTAHCTALLGSAWIAPRAGRHAGSFFTGPWKLNFAPASHPSPILWVHWVGRRSHGRACLRARWEPLPLHHPCFVHLSTYSHHHFQTTFAPSAVPVFTCDAPTSTHLHTYTSIHTHTHAPTSPADTPDLTHSRRSMWPP